MAADSKSASSLRSLPQLLLNFSVQYNLKITRVIYYYNILYFFKLPSKSIISLLFGELSNIDYFFTVLGIDSQPWWCVWGGGGVGGHMDLVFSPLLGN